MFSLSTFSHANPREEAVGRFAEATEKAAVNGFCHAVASEALERWLIIVAGPSVSAPRRPVGQTPGSLDLSGFARIIN